jgi:hypothetical protein
MASRALFEGLIYDEFDHLVTVAYIGTDAHYVVDDDGFHRHILAETVDRQVLTVFVEQLQANKEMAVAQALQMLGQDDLFTKAALDRARDTRPGSRYDGDDGLSCRHQHAWRIVVTGTTRRSRRVIAKW